MQTERQIKKAMLDAISRGENRSSLFWWMVENHDAVTGVAGSRIHWKSVTAKASALGLTDTTGKPFTERNARETWRQARAAVAKARERSDAITSASTMGKPPSRISPNWRPQEVIPPPPIRPAAPRPIPAQAGSLPAVGERSARVQAETDRIMAELAERDRKKFMFGG